MQINLEFILWAIILMGSIGLIMGIIIALTNKFFAVAENPLIEKANEFLPGANCGGCGFAGCMAFAKAMVEENADPALCPVNSADNRGNLSKLLGVESGNAEQKVAVILCCGDNRRSPEKAFYNGISDCNSAVLVAGATKACQHGCLGMASCTRACPFNAIEINKTLRMAKVHPEICVGCGKCVIACPRNLIKLVPVKSKVYILCNSPEKAPVQRAACSQGCIGCKKCIKEAGEEKISMRGFLAVANYETDLPLGLVDTCPVKCIRPAPHLDKLLSESSMKENKK